MSIEALRQRKKEETEKKVRLMLLIRFSEIIAILLMVTGFILFLVILYFRYYS